jgi:hypothetical protein
MSYPAEVAVRSVQVRLLDARGDVRATHVQKL